MRWPSHNLQGGDRVSVLQHRFLSAAFKKDVFCLSMCFPDHVFLCLFFLDCVVLSLTKLRVMFLCVLRVF